MNNWALVIYGYLVWEPACMKCQTLFSGEDRERESERERERERELKLTIAGILVRRFLHAWVRVDMMCSPNRPASNVSVTTKLTLMRKKQQKTRYSQLSLSRGPRDSLKYFKISVLGHIRFAELRKKYIEQPNFKWINYLTPEVRDTLKILWKRGEIAPLEQFLLFSTIFCYHVENRDYIFTSRYAVIQKKRVRDNECRLYFMRQAPWQSQNCNMVVK